MNMAHKSLIQMPLQVFDFSLMEGIISAIYYYVFESL